MTLGFVAFMFALALVESLLVFACLWLAGRLLGASDRVRDLWFLVLSYSGLFSMGGGTVAFVVPVPLVLGAPVWAVTLDRAATAGTGWILWRPAPLLTLGSTAGVSADSSSLLALELAALGGWALVASAVVYLMRRRRSRAVA